MDQQNSESYEFLDLSDVNDSERKEIIKTLYQNNKKGQQSTTTRTTTATSTTTTTSQLQLQHHSVISSNFHPQIVFFPPPQQHFYIHPQFESSFLQHQQQHHHHQLQHIQLQHQPQLQDQQQSSTSASETTSVYRSSSVSNCSDSTSDCVTPSGSVLNLSEAANTAASNSSKNYSRSATVVRNISNSKSNSASSSATNINPPPPTYSAVVYGGVGSRGSGPTTSLTTTTSSSSSSSSKRQPHFNGNNDLKNPNFEDDFENNHLPNHQKPRHFKRYVKTTHVDHSTQNTKGKSSGSSNSKTSTNNLVGNSTTTLNMTQQQQQQSQQNQQPQQSAPQPQNVSQSNNNNQPASNNGNTVAAVAANNSLNNFHPHGGYGTVPYTVHHGGHSIYPAVIPATLPPGNVYVNNVTANVNVGWTPGHPGVQAAYIPSSQSYITAGSAGHPVEVVGDQPPPVMQPVHMSLPVRNRTPHRGRGRGGPNGNNSRRSEYTPRQQQDSPNQASQSAQQRTGGGSGANSNNMPPSQQQQQTPHQPQHQPQQPPPQIESGTQATLSAYPYAYQYTYPAFYGHQGMMHSQTATAAQNVTGPPIYVAPYMGHPVYNYPFMYSPVMPQDYIYENNGETMFYAPIAETDINQNPAPGEAQILSPAGYPMYDPQMHEMHQQMNAVHLYDTQGTQPPPHLVGGPIVEIDQGAENIQIGGDQMTSPHDQESGIQVVPASATGAPTVVPVPGGPVPQEGPYILAPVVPVDNQLNNSGSEDLDTLSLHSNEMMIPLEMTSQIQPVPMAVPFIQPMEPQHSPVQYEAVPEHAVAPTAIPKEVVAIVGRDFNQNQMPNVPMNIEPEIPIESISFQQNVIEEHKIEEVSVSIQQEPAVQIESKINMNSTSSATTTTVGVTNNHVEEAAATISNVADGTMVHTTITKSMSWTNQQHNHQPQSTTHHHQPQQHHYNKKSTASVAVTATPTPSNGKSFTPSTKQQTASTTTTPSPQVKNHGAMKTPSSPVGVQNSTTNNNNSSTKGTTTSSSTSTVSASATAVPQQLQESKKTTSKSQSNLVFTPPITTPTPQPPSNNTWASLFTPSPATTNFTTSSSAATPGAAASTQNNNSALPASSSTTNNSQTNANNATTTNSSSTATTNPVPMKPVAKVAPYESGAVSQQSSSSTAQPQNITNHTNNYSTIPGALSYSAASTQSLSSGVGGAQTANKKPQNSVASTVNKTTSSTTSTTTTSTNNKNRETSNACGDEWSFKLAKFLNKYKPDFNAVSLKPRGLMNKSNYCYINSILQALIGCPPFYNLLKNLPKQPTALQTEIKTPTLNAMVQLAAEFSTLPPGVRLNFNKREKVQKDGRTVKDDNNGGTDLQCDSAFEPSAIYKLWNLTRSDAEGRQEDAEEFLCFILNKLNDEMLEVIKLVNKPQAPKENGEADDDEDWQVIASNGKSSVFRQTDYGRTPLSDIFRGETRSRLQREGGMSKDAVQPFFTLQLNIEKAASVKEALDLLVGREQLEGFSCSKTNQEVVAWQQMLLEKLPVVLILHLKWFDYKGDGCSKILKNVEFPVELSLDNKIVSSKKNSKGRVYRLFAVVYHDGKEATKGHYITDVYHPGYLNWLRFDDSSVKPISEKTVLMPTLPRVPYLLLYRRSDTFVAGQPEHHSTLAAHKKNNQKNNN